MCVCVSVCGALTGSATGSSVVVSVLAVLLVMVVLLSGCGLDSSPIVLEREESTTLSSQSLPLTHTHTFLSIKHIQAKSILCTDRVLTLGVHPALILDSPTVTSAGTLAPGAMKSKDPSSLPDVVNCREQ